MHPAEGKGGGAKMGAQYKSLCSSNDVILRARGVKKVPKPACILNQCSLNKAITHFFGKSVELICQKIELLTSFWLDI